MKGKLIAGLIVSSAVIIGAVFTVSSIDSTKQGVTNKVVASKTVSSGNNQGQATSSNNVAGGSNTTATNNETGSGQNSNSLREENNNKLSNYLGNWEVSKDVGSSIEGMTENAPSLIGSKLEMTNDTYSFNGVTINNPYYYVQSVSARDLFGQDGATGVLGNQENLDRLIVSSKPLTASEVKNNMINGLNPTIILNNSNIYVFGGGKNHAQIDELSQSSSLSGTSGSNGSSSNGGSTQHAPGAGAHVNNMNNGSPTPVSLGSGKIEVIKPSNKTVFGSNTIIVKNGTGEAISNSELSSVMRYWISSGANGYAGNNAAYGLMWAPQWLNTVSNSELVTAFTEANDSQALSKNISAEELANATIKLYKIVSSKPIPFTLAQATGYIKAMLAQSYPGETLTKVVQVKDGYYVYTAPFNSKGNSNPFWVVDGYTGYAQS